MKRYLIEEAKSGVAGDDAAVDCGLGPIVAAVKFAADGDSSWIYNVEEFGTASFYLSKEDIFDKLIQDDLDDREFHTTLITDLYINDFEGIVLSDYDAALESINKDPENSAAQLISLLIALTLLEQDESDELAEEAMGKYVDEIDIPEFEFEDEEEI